MESYLGAFSSLSLAPQQRAHADSGWGVCETVLPAKTRLYFSLALGVVGLVGLWGGDWLVPEEERTEEEKSVRKGVVRV